MIALHYCPVDVGYQVKGATLRAYLRVLERDRSFAAVRAKVSPESRALFDAPPPASSWMDASTLEEIMDAVYATGGDAAVRQLSHAAQETLIPLLSPLIEGALRLFGASPATLFARLGLLTRTSLRGVDFKWTPKGPHHGDVEVHFVERQAVPRRAFVSFAASFELVLKLCSKTGTVSGPEAIGKGSGARFAVSWR